MKNSILSVCLLCIWTFAYTQPKPDWTELQLKGKVRTVESKETYRYKKDGVNFTPWERTWIRLTKYNAAGFKTEYTEKNNKDSINYKIVYTYFPKDKKSEAAYFNRQLKPTTKTIYIHDDKNFKIEEIQHSPEGQVSRRYTYAYNDKGNLTTLTGYQKDGALMSKSSYKYDVNGFKSEYSYESPGYATSTTIFINDAKGNNIEEIWGNGRGVIDYRFVRTYDDKGNKIKEEKYKGGDTLSSTVTWKYEYDKNGNWIKRTQTTSSGEDFQIEERVITYY